MLSHGPIPSVRDKDMPSIRPAIPADLDALYEISLATGHLGGDASHLYVDAKMMGHIYSAPYLKLSPDLCFVAEDRLGVAGFAVGALDTAGFEQQLEQAWWPELRQLYEEPDEADRANWTADQRRGFMIHHPERAPESVVAEFPSHLHLNLLPRLQGVGIGRGLLDTWLSRVQAFGSAGVHVASNSTNRRAVTFWMKAGFEPLNDRLALPAGRTEWLGRRTAMTHRNTVRNTG